MEELAKKVGADQGLMEVLAKAIGGSCSVQIYGSIPTETLAAAMRAAGATPIQEGFAMAMRAHAVPAPGKKTEDSGKVTLSSVVDQSAEGKVEKLDTKEVRDMFATYARKYGALPAWDEEPSREQISAMKHSKGAGQAPYCDFGALGPQAAERKPHSAGARRRHVQEGDAPRAKQL